MSLFGYNFKKHHVCKLEADKKYAPAQLRKLAIENYFIARKSEPGSPNPLTNTVLFLSPIEKEQLASHLKKKVGTRIYSHEKPYVFTYPDKESNRYVCVQTLTAVVIVTNDSKARFQTGATIISNPTVTLHYGNTGRPGEKEQLIFHLDDTVAFGMLSQEHSDFSASQQKRLAESGA